MADGTVPLADAIRSLRGQLVEAMRAGEGEEVQFRLGPVELELQVEVSSEVGADAGVRFWVVSISGKGSRASSSVHTLKLTLQPVARGGGELVVADADAAEVE